MAGRNVRGERTNDLIIDDDGLGAPVIEGQVRNDGGDLVAYIGGSVKSLTGVTAGGLTAAQHRTLLQLIHFIDNGPAEGFVTGATRTTTGTAFPSQILWKRSDATNLVEKNITYTGAFPTTIEWKMYDTDGSTVLATVTDTISYSGAFETGRTRAIS